MVIGGVAAVGRRVCYPATAAGGDGGVAITAVAVFARSSAA